MIRLWQGIAVASVVVVCFILGVKDETSQRLPVIAASSVAPSRVAASVQLVGKIQSKAIEESSGIVASRKQSGVFWTHNDKGNKASLYAITRDGSVLGDFRIDAKNQDWEDIASDDAGNLYIGNIGNNQGLRSTLEVLQVAEPAVRAGQSGTKRGERLEVGRRWRLKYPGWPFDCESLFVHSGKGYVVSKVQRGIAATIYEFPLDQGDEVVLKEVTALPVRSPVTAASLSNDGAWLAVMSNAGAYLFQVNGDIVRAGQVQPEIIRLPKRQFEAVCFADDGILMTAETGEIYFYHRMFGG